MRNYVYLIGICFVLFCSWAVSQEEVYLGEGVTLEWTESWPSAKVYKINQSSDDGTELDNSWYPNGYTSDLDYIGKNLDGNDFISGFRFEVPELEQGEVVKYARLRLATQGGDVTSQVNLLIKGVAEDSPETFSDNRRPSQLPKTVAGVEWTIDEIWPSPGDGLVFYDSSPDLAGIINEILARPNWGQDEKAVILTIEDNGSPQGQTNYLKLEDRYNFETGDPAILEVYSTLADAFVGKPLLGRPTDTSITINVLNLLTIDIYAEYGTDPGSYPCFTTPLLNQSAQEPIEIVIDTLQPDTTYYYRIRYKEPDDVAYLEGNEGRFHTQRPRGSGFVFAIQADAHPYLPTNLGGGSVSGSKIKDWMVYEQTLNNIASDQPDFLIDLGDFVDIEAESYARNAFTFQEVVERYLEQRKYIDKITCSIPFYLVVGNHEAEQGWRTAEDDDLEEWATLARKKVIPNPSPDVFYLGNHDDTACCGLREDYYAWEWGDALFVVLDPFWYTTKSPHWYTEYPRQGNGWEWTLGEEQYNWLYNTLHNSTVKWKFVFSHHETGGVKTGHNWYGRGGVESAKYKVESRPSFE